MSELLAARVGLDCGPSKDFRTLELVETVDRVAYELNEVPNLDVGRTTRP